MGVCDYCGRYLHWGEYHWEWCPDYEHTDKWYATHGGRNGSEPAGDSNPGWG